jgi:hypothetical protein
MGLKSKPLDKVRDDVPVQAVTKEEVTRININVPASVRQRWKMVAVQQDIALTDLIVSAVSEYLDTHKL